MKLFFVFISCIMLLFSSCSQSPPRINAVQLRLVYHQGDEYSGFLPVERLSLMVAAEDDDGMADLGALYLVHDRDQLYWTMQDSDWILVERSGRSWIGSHAISMHDNKDFPRGAYRLVLEDKGGARAERIAAFDAPLDAALPFPSFSVENNSYRVESAYPSNTLVLYDSQGSMIRTLSLTANSGTLRSLNLPSAAQRAALFAEDPDTMIAAFTETVSLK